MSRRVFKEPAACVRRSCEKQLRSAPTLRTLPCLAIGVSKNGVLESVGAPHSRVIDYKFSPGEAKVLLEWMHTILKWNKSPTTRADIFAYLTGANTDWPKDKMQRLAANVMNFFVFLKEKGQIIVGL